MVVCRCRKATNLYCFVHKAPVCGECISFPEHKLCVVKTYSDWVIDGDYDWPPHCSSCQQVLEEEDDVTRLGCFHILHTACLENHLRSYPLHTAPAGYMCPSCSTIIWPPKLLRDGNLGLHSKLKQVITQSGLGTTLLGNDLNSSPVTQKSAAPPAFASPALVVTRPSSTIVEESTSSNLASVAALPEDNGLPGEQVLSVEGMPQAQQSGAFLDAPEASSSSGQGANPSGSGPPAFNMSKASPPQMLQIQNGAMTRKNIMRGDNWSPSTVEYDDDEDGSHRKYSRRGPLIRQVMRSLLPFWSPALPTLPTTALSFKERRDAAAAADIIDGGPRQKHAATLDLRKFFLWVAIMACMATALLLYYRLVQGIGGTGSLESRQTQDQ